jgi:hypothetical protein
MPDGAGTLLTGGYRLGEQVSSGGMGAVHRGWAPDGEPVALKRLLDLSNAARFEIESRLLARLSHPRVVPVRGRIEDESGQYLIMDWVEGVDLGRHLRERGSPGLAFEEVQRLALEAGEALSYIHGELTVHRDVKPQNLMLAGSGVTLVDFGIARDLGATSQQTVEIGTPGFMAPEAYVGGPYSPRTDVYGLAATVWTLLAGKPPALGQRGAPPGLSGPAAATLRAALEVNPERRLPSIDALIDGLGGTLPERRGSPLAVATGSLMEAVVRTAAGVFDAAAVSVALTDPGGGLVYVAAWGTGADEIVGQRLEPGQGISGAVVVSREGEVVDCRTDPRFAAAVARGTGYVPQTMIAVPLIGGQRVAGALNVLDHRAGSPYGLVDLQRAQLFADLAMAALASDPDALEDLAPTQAPS